jgi:hypothetical protein
VNTRPPVLAARQPVHATLVETRIDAVYPQHKRDLGGPDLAAVSTSSILGNSLKVLNQEEAPQPQGWMHLHISARA